MKISQRDINDEVIVNFINGDPKDSSIDIPNKKDNRLHLVSHPMSIYVDLFDIVCIYGTPAHVERIYNNSKEIRKELLSTETRVFELIPGIRKEYIQENHKTKFQTIIKVVKLGNFEMMHYLFGYLTESEKIEVVKAGNYYAIKNTAQMKHPLMLHYLFSHLSDAKKKEVVMADNFEIIRTLAEKGQLELSPYYLQLLSDAEKIEAMRADHYEVISYTARTGSIDMTESLLNYLPEAEKKIAIGKCLRWVAKGSIEMIQYLENLLTIEEIKAVVREDDCAVIRNVAYTGDIERVQYFERYLTEAEKKLPVKAKYNRTLEDSIRDGHNEMALHLLSHLSDDEISVQKMVSYHILEYSVQFGRIEVTRRLLSPLSEDQRRAMITKEDYRLFIDAVRYNCVETVQFFESYLTDEEKKAAAKRFISIAFSKKDIAMVQHFFSYLNNDEKNALIKKDNYLCIRTACDRHYSSFKTAQCLISFLECLESPLTSEEKIRAAEANSYEIIKDGFQSRDLSVRKALLNRYLKMGIVSVQVAESYGEKDVLQSFIKQQIADLRARKIEIEKQNPSAIFDVSQNEAQDLFYIISNLIQRDNVQWQDDIVFLLKIPAVKAAVTSNTPNELLRLATCFNNRGVSDLLRDISADRRNRPINAHKDTFFVSQNPADNQQSSIEPCREKKGR